MRTKKYVMSFTIERPMAWPSLEEIDGNMSEN